ncbi:ATP-binding cassette domain-containing protein [Paenibacillus sp. GCM10027626]|uniref:ATP-binding cassette domain-containing protein n=1 Tax=Paenibacillus sp. GCM10027626 TaxID=3273411 RepID=UPI00363AC788
MLELRQVTWRRNGSDFQLSVPRLVLRPGITLLVGRNGAGKSSFLQLLATAQFPTEGEIRYNGMSVERNLATIRSQIGFVPTGIELYEEMKTSKLLHYLSELKGGVEPRELDRLIEHFNLEKYRSHKIKTLAQGVRQRIALAQAWIATPAYIFLDEPLNALDSLERINFTRFVAAHAQGRTIIVSTHELNEWEAWGDRVLWLDEGSVRYHGTLHDWQTDINLTVWAGEVEPAVYRQLDADRILHVRPQNNKFYVRLIGNHVQPAPQFSEQAVTMEDAYFIRRRLQTVSK